MNKKILKQLVHIQTTNYFQEMPDDLKSYIRTFVRSSPQKKKSIPSLQKSGAIKTAIMYSKQKHPQIYHPKKTFLEWFFRSIAFYLFLNQNISFDISGPNDLLTILISKKKENIIKLDIYQDEKNCEYTFKIRSDNVWKPCYPLFSILYKLFHYYNFPIFYSGMISTNTLKLLYSLEDEDIHDFYLDYPFYMSRISEKLTDHQDAFVRCVKTISTPYVRPPDNSHPRQDNHGKITFQDFIDLYNDDIGSFQEY